MIYLVLEITFSLLNGGCFTVHLPCNSSTESILRIRGASTGPGQIRAGPCRGTIADLGNSPSVDRQLTVQLMPANTASCHQVFFFFGQC